MGANLTTKLDSTPNRSGVYIEWRWVKFTVIALLLIAVGTLLYFLLRGSATARGTRLLTEAFSKRRVIEARFTGGFKGAAFNPAPDDMTGIDTVALERAKDLISDAVRDDDPDSQLAYGRLLLLTGNKGAETLRRFRKAAESLPKSSAAHNDLGVCLIERGRLEDAIDEFTLALQYQAEMPEALFNRALCYEHLLLRDAASQDYTDLLRIERDRSWVDEIKQRQQEVTARITLQKKVKVVINAFSTALDDRDIEGAKGIASQNLEFLLKHVYNECAVNFLKAEIAGDKPTSDRTLFKIQTIGDVLFAKTGDTSIADFVSYLMHLAGAERQTEINLISEFIETELGLNKGKDSEAQPILLKLSKQFTSRGNLLFAYYTTLRYANYYYSTRAYSTSIKLLEPILTAIEKYTWPYRRAILYNQFGAVYSRVGRNSLAFKYCEQAISNGRGMRLQEAKAFQTIANAYANLGDLENGLANLRRSTALYLANGPTSTDLASNYFEIAQLYSLLGNHALTLLYTKQSLAFSEGPALNRRQAQATSGIAVEYAWMNQFDQAQAALNHAFESLNGAQKELRAYTEALAFKCAGEIAMRRGDFAEAAQHYSKAAAAARQSQEETIPLINILRGRADAYAQAKDRTGARTDLEEAIRLIESYRANISGRTYQSEFFDASQNVFDDMIALNVEAFGDGQTAFNSSEQSRARTLLDDLAAPLPASQPLTQSAGAAGRQSSAAAKLLTLDSVQAALPDDLRLISYSITSHGTYIFLITHTGFEWVALPVTLSEIDRLVQDYVSQLKSLAPLAELSENANKLYRLLIGPIAGRLNDSKRLCIVPDKALHFLPFAALVDDANRYLIETYYLTYAPSASALAQCLDEARRKGSSGEEKLLAVGNPLFNREAFPTLVRLPDSEREASESALPYHNPATLLGPQATKAAVRAALKECDVAHLALHSLVEEKSPWLAALVLAQPETEASRQGIGIQSVDDDLLRLHEIYDLHLPKLKLVILSACQSGLGQYYRGEGIVSLARPFLALRVPTVVVSLWSVDSQATASLMIDFHRERKSLNPGAGDALRAAQFKMASGVLYSHPYYWAPFIVVGSN